MGEQGKRANILVFEFDSESAERHVTPVSSIGGFSRVERGADLVRRAEKMGVEPAALMARYDEALPYVSDLFDRYRRMLERLDDPLYLSDASRASHERYLAQGRQVVCEVFAKHDYVRGIDSLVEHGIVDASDLMAIVERLAGNPKTITAIARLLEQKRRIPGSAKIDYEL